MNTKSIEALGFSVIRSRMASHCRSEEGKGYLSSLGFLSDRDPLAERQSLVGECVALLGQDNGGFLRTFPSIALLVEQIADPISMVEGPRLIDLASYIEAARLLFDGVNQQQSDGSSFPLAAHMMGPSFPEELSSLSLAIRRDLDESGEVRATHPSLVKLSHEVERVRSRRTQYCRQYIRDHSDVIQNDQEALRDGRLVIPIRREAHSQVAGFVSSSSSSGSTLFMEPFALVELNNSVVMAQNQILIEVAKILSALASQARSAISAIKRLQRAVGETDGTLAIALWIREMSATATDLESGRVRLIEARHPLLGRKAVPITLAIDEGVRAVVFSGPNAGGKTVSIKTVALFAMINQFCGHVPAKEGSSLPLFDDVFCDIGDEQSIDDDLSTFSGHMKNIASILASAGPRSLILFDELGSGTEAVEGSAIAQAILEYAHRRAHLTLVTSHHTLLKQYAYAKKEIINASMAFDERSLEPTFTIVVGLPGESHALDMARSMGLPPEVITQTEQLLGGEQLKLSAIIKDLEGRRIALEEGARSLERRRLLLQNEVKAVQLKELRLNQELAQIKGRQLSSLERFTREKRKEIELLIASLRREGASKEETAPAVALLSSLNERIEAEESALKALEETIEEAKPKGDPVVFEVGMDVLCGPSKREGKILKKLGKGRYQVAIDAMKMTLKASDLKAASGEPSAPRVSYQGSTAAPKAVIDLRGCTLEEALSQLALQIESALVHGMESFAIIHGYGDGILSRGIAEYLKGVAAVKDYRFALPEDGGMGKTYVMF
ncbi:MAG TPA: Smr/MutS family protein [Sphaerochaeta sp.]|nr:Smr/MutS family protein [Sphaerochaeta sp.]